MVAHSNAAFVLHPSSKLHVGVVVMGRVALVYVTSQEIRNGLLQQSTKSALVVLTANIGFVKLFKKFLSFILAIQPRMSEIYQNSTDVTLPKVME